MYIDLQTKEALIQLGFTSEDIKELMEQEEKAEKSLDGWLWKTKEEAAQAVDWKAVLIAVMIPFRAMIPHAPGRLANQAKHVAEQVDAYLDNGPPRTVEVSDTAAHRSFSQQLQAQIDESIAKTISQARSQAQASADLPVTINSGVTILDPRRSRRKFITDARVAADTASKRGKRRKRRFEF